jgi:co-chaperonin GroES (HSP10)
MSGLLMPRHVAAQMQKTKVSGDMSVANSIQRTAINRLTSDDFASPAEVQKQLDDLSNYVAEMQEHNPAYRLPLPSGWRLTVLMLTIAEVTEGGVHIVNELREQQSMSSPQGVILSVGPAAYSDPTRFKVQGEIMPWHKAGDRIIWTRYDATSFQLANGQRIGFMNDTQPAGLIDSGWDVSFATSGGDNV